MLFVVALWMLPTEADELLFELDEDNEVLLELEAAFELLLLYEVELPVLFEIWIGFSGSG